MRKSIVALAILSSVSTMSLAQVSSNSNIELSANVDAGCFLEADNINFGVLMMPLTDSSSQSNVKVLCSKGSSLKIQISYDNKISGSSSTYSYTKLSDIEYMINKNGTSIGGIRCYYDSSLTFIDSNRNLTFVSNEVADIFGLQYNVRVAYITDNICSGTQINVQNFNKKTGNMFAKSGVLQGVSSVEQIKYTIKNPSNNNVWTMSNDYSILGSGIQQTIPLVADIKRAENATHRLTPDTYQSTLTVILNY